jgi:hypothetical protein
VSPDDLPQLLALHGLNASRLGRLLRDKQALAGKGDNKLANALETTVSGWLGATLCQDDARHGRTN